MLMNTSKVFFIFVIVFLILAFPYNYLMVLNLCEITWLVLQVIYFF